MPTHRPITLLHLSDIQLQGSTEFESLLRGLLGDLRNLRAGFGLKPQVMIVSGDLAQRGLVSEFRLVKQFLSSIASELQLPKDNIVIVPGNHDINWRDCKEEFKRNPAPSIPYNPKWRKFAAFFSGFYGAKSKRQFTLEQPWTLFEIDSLKMVFAGINSTWHESHLKEHHYGFIGDKQIDWFINELEHYREKSWFRVGVLHHNIDIADPSDDSFLKDYEAFKARFGKMLHLVLHGHTHQGAANNEFQGIPILSTGSPVVDKDARPEEVPKQYQVIQIWPTHYRRWARASRHGGYEWIGDCSISSDGNSWNERRTIRFRGVQETFPDISVAPFGYAIGCLEAGDLVASQAILKCSNPADDNEFADRIAVKQKFGIFEEADLAELDLSIDKYQSHEARLEDYSDLLTIRVKLLSQQERFGEIEEPFSNLYESKRVPETKKRGILHRAAVAHAVLHGYGSHVEELFSRAKRISLEHDNNGHSITTTEVLSTVVNYFRGGPLSDGDGFKDAIGLLQRSQERYLRTEYSFSIGQAFPFKSSIQTLFAEAAILLSRNLRDRNGWNLLIAANLMNSRYVIEPHAEGYSELLSSIYFESSMHVGSTPSRKKLRGIIEAAMYSQGSERLEFLSTILFENRVEHLLPPMSEIYDLVPEQDVKPVDWKSVREFLRERETAN